MSEMRSVMQPLPYRSSSSNASSSSGVWFERRSKCSTRKKSKSSAVTRASHTFQKKLVVFKFLETNVKSFTRTDSLILMRGLLPELDIESSELEIF